MKSSIRILLAGICLVWSGSLLQAAGLDELSLDRWKILREAERYQLNIAEKYWREQNWKVALGEYEKFVTLYEQSEGASYAQMKWGLCLVNLRKQNTAIKDGFQAVVDYWPDSTDAVACAYFIGRTYKEMGEPKKAKQAYATLVEKHGKHLAAVYARVDLLDIARLEQDATRQVALWKELTYDIERTPEANGHCVNASIQLAAHSFATGSFAEGQKALATTYTPEQQPYYVTYYAANPISQLTAKDETKPLGEKVANEGIAWLTSLMPADLTDPPKKQVARQYWFYIADFHSVARRDDKVAEVYAQMEKQFGVDDEILGRLAAWYKGQKKRDEARSTYNRYANPLEGQNQIAYSYREEQKYDLAIPIYRALALKDTEHAPTWLAEMALTYRHAGKCDEAVGVYRELLAADLDRTTHWQMQIGHTYRDFGRYKEAIANFRLADSFPDSYLWMAWCHRQQQEWKEAIGLYTQVMIGHAPSAPETLLQIAYTHEQAGDKEKAIKSLQQVCDKFTDTNQASIAHAYLQDKFKISYTKGGGKKE